MPNETSPRLRAVALRRVLGLARPEAVRLTLGTVCLAISSATNLLFPQAIGTIVDLANGTANATLAIDTLAIGLIVIFLVQAVASATRFALFHISGERVVARLRSDLFARLMEQEIAFFDDRNTGELTNRLASDTTILQNTVSVNISMGLRFIVMVLGGVACLFYNSVSLALVMLSIVPPIALGAVAYGRRVRKLSGEVQDSLAAASEVAQETIAGIRTVRSFTAESSEQKKYQRAVMESFSLAKKRSLIGAVFMGATSFAAGTAIAGVIWYGAHLVTQGSLTPGRLTSFLVYTLLVAFSLGGLSELWTDVTKATGAAERIFELFDRVPTITPGTGKKLSHVDGALSFKNVVFSYPSRPQARVLNGLSLDVAPGQVVALVGPSGAGKSTIASLLSRMYDPDEGQISVDGCDIREIAPNSLRQHIGIVAQEPVLFSSDIATNIRYGRTTATDEEVLEAARAANADSFISKFPNGYQTEVGERGVQLSGGQKQRIAIARAVLKNPKILVLDEATSALDAESEHLVKEALERLMKGRTTLIIAHRLSTVASADRVCVIEAGDVVQSGTHASLMAEEGLYKRLVTHQLVPNDQ